MMILFKKESEHYMRLREMHERVKAARLRSLKNSGPEDHEFLEMLWDYLLPQAMGKDKDGNTVYGFKRDSLDNTPF